MSDLSVDHSQRPAQRVAPQPEPQSAQPPIGRHDASPRGADASARTDQVLAQATDALERRGTQGQRLLGATATGGEPELPGTAPGTDLDAAYRAAGATPPERAASSGEVTMPGTPGTPADHDGDPPTAADAVRNAQNPREAIDALGRRAGVDTSQGTGRMDPAHITRRADHISWSLQNNQPVLGPNGVVDIRMSAEERTALSGSDPDARRRTADAIGRRVATQESFERAVGGPENARRIEQSYQAATTEQRQADAPQIDRQANAERLANVIEIGSFALGGAGLARSLLARGGRALAARLGVGASRSGAAAHFSIDAKIARQMGKRGWDNQTAREAIERPARTAATRDTRHNAATGLRNDDPATAYFHRNGGYVVRNDRTGEIVQVSNRNDPGWINPF